MVIPSIVMLIIKKETLEEKGWLVFGITGACAFYFNMNYFQLLSFGMPLIFYFLVVGFPKKVKEMVSVVALLFIPWGIGYAGMMVFKWTVYAITIEPDMFAKMIDHIFMRSGTDQGSRWDGVLDNFNVAFGNVWWNIIELSFIVFNIIIYIKRKSKIYFSATEAMLLLIMIAMPIVRYLIFANHVTIHNWVTYRILMMSVLTFNILIAKAGRINGLEKV